MPRSGLERKCALSVCRLRLTVRCERIHREFVARQGLPGAGFAGRQPEEQMMKTRLWVTLAIACLLAVAALAPAALAQEKKSKPAAGSKTEQAMPPGCSMHGAGMGGAGMGAGEKGTGPGKAGCGMMGGGKGAAGMVGCFKGGAGLQCCGMQCSKGGAGRGGCGMHGGMGAGQCGPGMHGGMGAGQCGPGMHGGMGAGLCGPGLGCGNGLGIERLHELGLTPQQKTKLMDIHERWQRLAIQKQADIRIAMLDLQKLVCSEKPEKVRIDAAIDKVARLRAELAKSCIGARLEACSLLTPEQLKECREGALQGDEEEEEGSAD
jgi:Spy/CpxP family protein refolding chaperone